jgi:sarcosine oxidase subunit alpha
MAVFVSLQVDGHTVRVVEGISVAAAIAIAGAIPLRRSPSGEGRAPLCGMGVCFECRATVDGVEQQRTCLLPVAEGMEVVTHG